MQARCAGASSEKCCHIKLWRIIKKVVCLGSVQYYLHTILLWHVYYGNWCHLKNNKKNGAFDLFTCIIFSACQFLHYFFKKYAGCQVILSFIYIYIRNTEMYLPEVSVSSAMECSKPVVLYYTHCKLFVILIWKYCLLNKITFAR